MSSQWEHDLQFAPDSPIYQSKDESEDKEPEICEECEKPIGSGDIGECRCYSVCCGAPIIMHDICSDCKEHC